MSEGFIEKQPLPESSKINPELTQRFVTDIVEKSERGIYRVNVTVGDKSIPIDVYPGVFPPQSDHSVSSSSVAETLRNLNGKLVADVGSGTGIESIVAALAGAEHVDATDISRIAVDCTAHNVQQNDLAQKISVYHGDLLTALPKKKYDLIIANLPIVDYRPSQESDVTRALYDPGFKIHERLLKQAKEYLTEEGVITFTHANLQSASTSDPLKDFAVLEDLISEHGYEVAAKVEREELGFTWVNYRIKLKKTHI